MQGESQPKLNSPTCLGEAEFDCMCPELVYLIYPTLFILKQKILGIGFCYNYSVRAWSPTQIIFKLPLATPIWSYGFGNVAMAMELFGHSQIDHRR